MLETAPQPIGVLSELASFIGEVPVVGYYVTFDIHFLYDSFVRYLGYLFPNDYVDAPRFPRKLDKFTKREAMQIVADLGGVNLEAITKKTQYLILGNNDYCAMIKDGKRCKQKNVDAYGFAGTGIEFLPRRSSTTCSATNSSKSARRLARG